MGNLFRFVLGLGCIHRALGSGLSCNLTVMVTGTCASMSCGGNTGPAVSIDELRNLTFEVETICGQLVKLSAWRERSSLLSADFRSTADPFIWRAELGAALLPIFLQFDRADGTLCTLKDVRGSLGANSSLPTWGELCPTGNDSFFACPALLSSDNRDEEPCPVYTMVSSRLVPQALTRRLSHRHANSYGAEHAGRAILS